MLKHWLLWSLLVAAPRPAQAEEGPYNNHTVGDRALGLAGAVVSVADDPTAAFHNPGGLALLRTSSISGGFTAIGLGDRVVEDGYGDISGTGKLTSGLAPTLPTFLAGVLRFGPKDERGLADHAIAVSLLHPYRFGYESRARLTTGDQGSRLAVNHEERARWIGVSYARLVLGWLSLGASVFAVHESVGHEEFLYSYDDGPVAELATGGVAVRDQSLDLSVWSATLRLGAKFDVSPFQLGVMVQLPALALSGTAATTALVSQVDGGGRLTTSFQGREGVDGQRPIPWELRAGGSYRPLPDLFLSGDLSLLGPVSRTLMVDLPAGDPGLGLYVPRSTRRVFSVRPALGGAMGVTDSIQLAAGLFYQSPGAPSIAASASSFQPEHTHKFGGSLSGSYHTDRYRLTVGALGTMALGEAAAPRFDGSARSYVAADLTEHQLLFFINGAAQAASQIVRTVVGEDVGGGAR